LRNGRWHIGGAKATDQLGQRLSLAPTCSVLDVGCGIGGPARQIAETFGSTVVGVDHRLPRIIEAILRTTALGLHSRVSFHVADGEHLPFEDEVFDAVISQAMLDRIPEKMGAVCETFRVLKPGGSLGFECEALTEKAASRSEEESGPLYRVLAWQQLLSGLGFIDIAIEEMWEESRRFYPMGPEREQIDRGERVNVRVTARKP
jgi:ubiquinone/menaquinone biosynthesis C-methylase UbiE